MDTSSEDQNMRILVTVKTYPTPSQKHVETVCVAGVRIDTDVPSWVRLYPIPFRTMGDVDKFKKWQIVDVKCRARGTSDSRPESFSPDNATFILGDIIDSKRNWAKRLDLIRPLVGQTTTCELVAANRAVTMGVGAPSLGMIKPTVTKVEPVDFRDWTRTQLQKVELAAQGDLFTPPLKRLQPPPHRIRFHYRCEESGCRGHQQEVLDWELGVSGISWKKRYGAKTGEKILEHWASMVSEDKDTYFFVGNQQKYRQSFSVLGIWYPKVQPKA